MASQGVRDTSWWVNRQQQEVIEYLVEENRVLMEQREGGGYGRPTINAAISRQGATGSVAGF